jgi:hypothetical protein
MTPAKKDESVVDKLDSIKKGKFVDTYKATKGNISDSCRVAGISRQTYYDWLDKKDEFSRQIMEAEMELNDDIRDVLISKAGGGDMTAVIFYLKKRHPDFKEQPQQNNIQVNVLNNLKADKEKFGI